MPVDVAGDSKTPSCVLRWLAESDVEELLIKLGKNPNTPMDILVRLSDDERDRVRMAVGENPNTPLEVLKKLANEASGSMGGVAHLQKASAMLWQGIQRLLVRCWKHYMRCAYSEVE